MHAKLGVVAMRLGCDHRFSLYGRYLGKHPHRLTGEKTCSLSPKFANRTMYPQATAQDKFGSKSGTFVEIRARGCRRW